jgi:hypothetical protein
MTSLIIRSALSYFGEEKKAARNEHGMPGGMTKEKYLL